MHIRAVCYICMGCATIQGRQPYTQQETKSRQRVREIGAQRGHLVLLSGRHAHFLDEILRVQTFSSRIG